MIEFEKMHGLGNDFIMLNNIAPTLYNLEKLAVKLCNRQTGIGADGIVLVLPSKIADIQMRIINSDGSEPNMCGNAIRCFAKYVYENGIVQKQTFTIETLAGIIIPELIIENNQVKLVKVNMGEPKLSRADIPMLGNAGSVINEPLAVGDNIYKITSLLMNVPHTMIFVDNVDKIDVKQVGPQIEKHPSFQKGTNVNFVEVINTNEIKVRTWERGAGHTLACGTGSCAAGVASFLNKLTQNKVTVHLQLGDLVIEWIDKNVFMTGPAETVFSGKIGS